MTRPTACHGGSVVAWDGRASNVYGYEHDTQGP